MKELFDVADINSISISVMPNFAQRVQVAVDALSSSPPKDVDENEFIDASRLVYEGVREIRRAVLMNRVSSGSGCNESLYSSCRIFGIDFFSRRRTTNGIQKMLNLTNTILWKLEADVSDYFI